MAKIFEGEAMRTADLCCGSVWVIIAIVAALIGVAYLWVTVIDPAGKMIGSVLQPASPTPTPRVVTAIPTTQSTQVKSTSTSGGQPSSCNIEGKWYEKEFQDKPISGVYFFIYPDNRIELYLNEKLTYTGVWIPTNPNQYRFTWTHGYVDETTVSASCQTMDILNNKGEHAIFSR